MYDSMIFKTNENEKHTNTNMENANVENANNANVENAENVYSNEQFNGEEEYTGYNESNDEYEQGYEYNNECDKKTVCFIGYDLEEELNLEQLQNDYHINKNYGDWYIAKMIVSHAYQDKKNTDLFWDHLEKQFLKNGDSFDNITNAYYKNDLDIDIIYQFSREPARHLIDNLRIPAYKPDGIIFSNPEDANKWSFKIVVITNKAIYTANRYINENLIGCY